MHTLPPPATLYRAVVRRDSSFEGVFFTGVRTTGIFCRPTCTAKQPKRENVEFFATPSMALHGGYRPCKRCRPMDAAAARPESVTTLCDLVERDPQRRVTDHDLRAIAIDPSTARRQFRRHFGMTFHAYQRSRRVGEALRGVRDGKRLLEVGFDAGFESASGFRDAFARLFGAAPSDARDARCLVARWIATPLGPMVALADDEGLRLLEFVDRRGLEREVIELRRRLRAAVVPGTHDALESIEADLRRYFAGDVRPFSTKLAPVGSEFEMNVWRELRRIPLGETRSYVAMARAVGAPRAARAVGRANGRNRIAIAIPCHRVVRADGDLGGYAGTVARKQWLLDHERKMRG